MKGRYIHIAYLLLLLFFPYVAFAQSDITYQYWIDNNKEEAITGVTSDGADISLNLDMGSMSSGIHYYNIRAKENDKWGTVYRYIFSIPSTQQTAEKLITGYKYAYNYGTPTEVQLETPVEEYNLQIELTPPAPDPLASVENNCTFTFDQTNNTVELSRDVNVTFTLYFKDQSNQLSAPSIGNFVVNEVMTENIQTSTIPGSYDVDSHENGGFNAYRIDITEASTTLRFTLNGDGKLGLFSSDGTLIKEYQTSELQAGVDKTFADAGVYYAVVFGNTENRSLSIASSTNTSEPYAVLSEDNTVLTFYYDNLKNTRGGMGVGPFTWESNRGWNDYISSITSIVFDDSFSDCTTLTSTAYWFYNCSKVTSITKISNLKTDLVIDMNCMFYGCSSLTELDLSGFKTDNVTDMSTMFENCSSLESLDLSSFNTANVTNMSSMFDDCSSLKSLDVSHFNTDNVTNFGYMFLNCSSLESLDVANFNTSSATIMSAMFRWCSKLKKVDVSHFNTANVTKMSEMFYGCKSLTILDLSNFKTSLVTSMDGMFRECSELLEIHVGDDWNTDAVTYSVWMFYGCNNIYGGAETTYDENHIDASYAHVDGGSDNPGYLIDVNSRPVAYAVLTDNDNDVIIESASAKGKTLTFYYDNHKETHEGEFVSLETIGWKDVNTRITDVVFSSSFGYCSTLTTTSNWFKDCSNLVSITDLTKLRTDNVTDMSAMFSGCSSITSIDLGSFNTSKVTKMREMFYNCPNLVTIYVGYGWTTENVADNGESMFSNSTNLSGAISTTYSSEHTDYVYARVDTQDNPGYLTDKNATPYVVLSEGNTVLTFYHDSKKAERNGSAIEHYGSGYMTWYDNKENIIKVVFDPSFASYKTLTNTEWWFNGFSNLETIENIEYLKTDSVTSMLYMFSGCKNLTSINLEGFNTPKLNNMSGMFEGCSSLTSLDLSNFNTENVTNMYILFMDCSSLQSINLSGLNTEKVTDMGAMFENCSSLTTLDLSSFKTTNTTSTYSMFRGCSNLTTIYISDDWALPCTGGARDMFAGCVSIVGGAGTKYNENFTDDRYAHIDGGEENPGYLTKQKVLEQVKTPTFSFDDRNLILATETEDASILYEIKEYDHSLDNDSIAKIAAQMTISDTASVYKDPILIDKDVIVLARGTKEGLVNSNDTLLIYPCTEWEKLMYDIVPMGKQTLQDAEGNDMIPADLLDMFLTALATVSDLYNSDDRARKTRDEVQDIISRLLKYIDEIMMYKVVTITAKDYTREYGTANPKFEYSVEGAELSGTPTITCAATDTTSVGTYPITITYTKADSESTLNVTCVEGTLTITKAPLTITAKSYTIKRGEAIPTLEATYTGFKNKETEAVLTKAPTLSTTAKSDSEAGSYDITVSGAAAKNYDIEYENGTLTITDEVTVTAKNYTRVYGEANPKFEYRSEGATLSGKPTLSCEATATSPVGTYDIVVAQGSITNREVTYVYGTLTITKAPLSITAKDYTIKQGKPLPTFEVEYSGFKNKETDTVFTTKPIVSTTATSKSEPGTYDITVSGAEANNYETTYVSGKLTITKRTENFDGVVLTVEKGGVIEDAFEYRGGKAEVAKTIAAVVWNDSTELKAEMLDGISNPNLLIYVSDEKLAPSGFNNVVINGKAKNITLTDGGTGNYNFYVPQEFKADSISYSREFKQTTQDSISRGWEGIALPFTVETFTHEEHGNISPFGNDACEYHFWLRQPTKDGVVSAKTIEANKPYIISMPNSEEYEPEFNQAGWIKFASANAKVPVTETEGVWLGDSAQIAPTFLEVEQSPDIYVLNVGDSIQGHPEGSIFVSNYRKVRPFEVYTFHEFSRSGSRIISLSSLFGGNNGSTDMGVVTVETHADVWYDLNGRRLQGKPTKSGLYIHNGKKEFIRP